MLLACLIVASVGLCLGDQDEVVDERLALLEKKMTGLEEENKYLRTKSMKTCEDLKNSPYNETGVYTMDPDGSGQPVEVFCDVEKGVTEIGHDHLVAENVTWCEGAGCYSLNLTYDVPIQQIEALIAMSDTCEQEIKFECKLAPLKNAAFGVKYGWWTNQRDEKKYYFDGADEESEVCDINHNGGVCNCDMSLVPLWNSDSGRITNKNSLPIKGFHYGGFFNEHQAARVTIGKLKCSGQSTDSKDLVSTCSSLKKSGLSSNGFYLTKDFYEMTNIQFEPKTSVYFDITDTYFKAKMTGLYAFHSQDVQMTIDEKWISNNDDTNYIMVVTKGQMIKFKVADRKTRAKGTMLTIYKLK